MKKCPTCKTEYEHDVIICPKDNIGLINTISEEFIGKVINERYLIDKLLGVGGIGYVYRAKHLQLGTYVALKVLNPDLVASSNIIERFRREARAALAINHPNAIKIMDFGISDGSFCYIVMEFLDGAPLKDVIFQEHTLSIQVTVRIFTKVCAAIAAAHKKNILHRDLKPDNIFILGYNTDMEEVKVLDFSIAKIISEEDKEDQLTETGVIIGTPAYMSPEQVQSIPLDERSDIYSLGICLYESLTGTAPFKGNSSMALAIKHIHALPRAVREINPLVPPAIEAVVMKAISKRPEDRFSSAEELAKGLEEALVLSVADESSANFDPIYSNTLRVEESHSNQKVSRTTLNQFETDTVPNATLASQTPTSTKNISIDSIDSIDSSTPAIVKDTSFYPSYSKPSTPTMAAKSRNTVGTSIRNTQNPLPLSKPNDMLLATEQRAVTTNIINKRSSFIMLTWGLIVIIFLSVGGYVLLPMLKKTIVVNETDPYLKNMIFITGDTFSMGRNLGPEVEADETPAHQVTVSSFWLSKYEITNQEYQKFVLAENYHSPVHWDRTKYLPGTENYPVTNVSWEDANNYCQWISKQSKFSRTFRLPTEVEWEYAAHGVENRLYPWGNAWATTFTVSGDSQISRSPVPVESEALKNDISPFQIIGLAGNVTEWTSSNYYVYPGSTAKYNPGAANTKILRGGNYLSEKTALITTYRPSWYTPDFRDERVGFRVAADAKPEDKPSK